MNVSSRARAASIAVITILIILIIGALLVLTIRTGTRLYSHVIAIKERLDRVETLVNGTKGQNIGIETFRRLRQETTEGQAEFLALKADITPFLPILSRLGWLPRIGPSLEAIPSILTMGEHFFAAGSVALEGLEPLLKVILEADSNSSQKTISLTERVLPPLLDAQPTFVYTQDHLEQAIAARKMVESSHLHPLLARQLERLDKYVPVLRSASQGAIVAPILLGAVKPMRYIVLAQNNDELRPTGGFISAIGVLTVDKGRIAELDFRDSYSVDNWQRDHPEPPVPLLRYMDSQLWVFRDANFWPDFPTSAKAVEYFAALDLDLQPDGVIAVDQFALQILIGGMGSVIVPEYDNDVLTGNNTITKIRAYWEPPLGTSGEWSNWLPWYSQRKEFMSHLVNAMRTKLETDPRSINLVQFGKAVLQALNQKHILIYLRNPLGAGLTDISPWGGAISPTKSDYLFVVDTNMGFNKTNGIVQRSIDYTISIDNAGLARSLVTITYHNPSQRDIQCIHDSYYEATYDLMMNRCYWNYLRVYVPEGATLIADESGPSMENAGIETGKQVWATWLVVAPREKLQVVMGYYLPKSVLRRVGDFWEYYLLVQKQPGTHEIPLRVTVTLPVGAKVIGANPTPKSMTGNVVQFEDNLLTDQEFRVLMR